MARQTMVIFSQHDPDDVLAHLSREDIQAIARFYRGRSSRQGALNDLTHEVGEDLLRRVSVPTLVVHSREDASIPFAHAEWSLEHIPHAQLYQSGMTGHFFWIGPDYPRISQQLTCFLREAAPAIDFQP
jgi:pimeloyl-ACP methyl ester carboxylesterase